MGKTLVNMRGSLWKNKKKTKTNQPDYTGNALIDEQDYFLSGWIDGEGDKRKISISFNKIEETEPKSDEDLF